MNIVTVNVGQGALAIVRHRKEAIIVDCRVPPASDLTVAYVKEMLALALKDHHVKGLILTGFDNDHTEIVGASIVLKKYRPDWVMYPKCYKDSDEAKRVFALIDEEVESRRWSANPLEKKSVRVDQLPSRRLTGLSDRFEFELFSPHIEDMDSSNNSSIVLKLTGRGIGRLLLPDHRRHRERALGNDQPAVRHGAQVPCACRPASRIEKRDSSGIAAQYRPAYGPDQRRRGQPVRSPPSASPAGL